jgi:transposase-like protein
VRKGQIKDGFTPAGSQRYRCKACGCRYTPQGKERGYDEEVRLQALTLHLEGNSLRQIGRLLNVNHQSVANWIDDFANLLSQDLPPSILELAVLDGFYVPPHKRKRAQGQAGQSTPRN